MPTGWVSMSILACQTKTLPLLILPLSNIPLIGTPPVRCSLAELLINPQHTKQHHSPKGVPSNWRDKRAHSKTTKAKVSSRCSTPQGDREPPEMPPEACKNGVSASRSAEKHNNMDNTDQSGDKSTQDESRENAADSDLELTSGNCLSCSDTEEPGVRMAQQTCQKRVQVSCSIAIGCPWSETQVR